MADNGALNRIRGTFRVGRVTPEDIERATQEFDQQAAIPVIWKGANQYRNNFNAFNAHANAYPDIVRSLREYYPSERTDRSPRDKASNYAGAYDYAQRVRDTEPMQNVIDAAKASQMLDYIQDSDRRNDAVMDYLENKAGVEAAYADLCNKPKSKGDIMRDAVIFTEAQGYADGGKVNLPDLGESKNQRSIRPYHYTMKDIFSGDNANLSNTGISANTDLGDLNIGMLDREITERGRENAMKMLAANYGLNLGDLRLDASVQKPLNTNDVYIGMLNGSIPIGEGRAMLGLQGVKTPMGSDVNALTAGYQGKLGDGHLSGTFVEPMDHDPAGRQLQLQYSMPFADGGEVNTDSIDSAISDYAQLLDAYPNAKKFLASLGKGVEETVPTYEEMRDPQAMLDWGLSNNPVGILSTYGIPKKRITVNDPERVAYPGIYDRPDEIARIAAQNVSDEDPAMKRLFGVTRDDLYEIRKSRPEGNEAPNLVMPANPKGAKIAPQIMTRRNAQRIIDTLSEAEKYPELQKGMDAWYEMGPLYERYKQISDDPIGDFKRFQIFTGMASPGSDVLTEINRGSAALMLANQQKFNDFIKHAGKSFEARKSEDFPEYLAGVMGHPYHSTAHGKPISKYVDTGNIEMDSPKVPLYIQSAGVPETGYQTDLPVGDAHWSRGVGLADVRTSKDYGASVSMPELLSIGPWWREKIAKPLGTNAVNAQARAWGTFAPATGVETTVGAPKLELISQKIMDAANAYGISPEEARDLILMGKMYAPNLNLLNMHKKYKLGE